LNIADFFLPAFDRIHPQATLLSRASASRVKTFHAGEAGASSQNDEVLLRFGESIALSPASS
jgi:hypothetical protein